MDATKLKVWLPFDESATEDKCGNSWTAYGTTSIDATNAISGQALQLNKGYLRSDTAIEFGGANFTVDFYAYMNSSSEQWAGLFVAQSTTNTMGDSRRGQIAFHRNNTANTLVCNCYDANGSKLCDVTLNNTSWLNGRHHFELDYSHAISTLKIFIDGELSLTQTVTLERLSRYIFLGVNSYDPPVQRMVGTIDEFRLFDGVALHSEDFTPPTAADYDAITSWAVTANADVEALIANRDPSSNYWRYENPGSGDYILYHDNINTENVGFDQSVTGVAFWGGDRNDMAGVPAGCKELWVRLDLFLNAGITNYYNSTSFSFGCTSSNPNSLNLCGYSNLVWVLPEQSGWSLCIGNTMYFTLTPGKINSILLYLRSGKTDGMIQGTVSGHTASYTGNVNGGGDFSNLFFTSSKVAALYSNIVASNAPLSLEDGWHREPAAVEFNIKAVDLCVRKNGRTYEIPFSTTNSAPVNSVVARVGHKTVYNPLVATTDENASVLKVRCNGEDRALSASFN